MEGRTRARASRLCLRSVAGLAEAGKGSAVPRAGRAEEAALETGSSQVGAAGPRGPPALHRSVCTGSGSPAQAGVSERSAHFAFRACPSLFSLSGGGGGDGERPPE